MFEKKQKRVNKNMLFFHIKSQKYYEKKGYVDSFRKINIVVLVVVVNEISH